MRPYKKFFIDTYDDIRSLTIQGAESIAYHGSKAVLLQLKDYLYGISGDDYNPKKYDSYSNRVIRKMLGARPTEPHLKNSINVGIGKNIPNTRKEALSQLNTGIGLIESHYSIIHSKVSYHAKRALSQYSIAYTHCHSSFVREAILSSNIKTVYNTETRPLYQGRITAKGIANKKVVHHYVDSGMSIAISKSEVVLLGADSITLRGDVINKIGSGMAGIIAKHHKKPLYVITGMLKLDMESAVDDTIIEERNLKEIWVVRNKNIIVHNPAFELLESKYITGIICEEGILTPKEYVRKAKSMINSMKE